MKKIKSTKAFKDAVDVAFDTQTKRDRKKREYDEQRKAFDERHDALCEYALGHPEVFDPGEDGRSREGSTDRVKYKLTSGEALERIDGGSLSAGRLRAPEAGAEQARDQGREPHGRGAGRDRPQTSRDADDEVHRRRLREYSDVHGL